MQNTLHKKTKLLLLLLFPLWGLGGYSQNYQWDWALNGGGSVGSGGWNYQVEQIFDIAIDSNNNYYFVAKITSGTPKLNGQSVTAYGNPQGGNNIFIFSTTCDGQVRWSQAIGGGGLFDAAYNIALDSNNNVYVGVNVLPAGPIYPVHFSPTETLPSPPANPGPISDYYKTTFLVKYDTNGQFVWKRALQGDVDWTNWDSTVLSILIDSNDTIHFIVGLFHGTHLNNTVTVPTTSTGYQYYLVRYSSSGQLLNSTLLPVADGTGFVPPSFTFKLDEANNRYYIAGFRSYSNVNEDIPLTYGGSAIINNAYILAIDAGTGSEIWRREMQPEGLVFHDNRIYDLDVDTNGDIYIAGKLFKGSSENGVIKIINPKNPAVNAYTFNITSIQGNMPFIARLNKNGVVQWARTPTNDVSNMYYSHSLALRGNEVALATEGGSGMVWDSFSMSRPAGVGYQPDPVLVRFSKQTGTVVGLHDIEGNMTYDKLTVVEVDNDGNYVVGGAFKSNLFGTHPTINMLVTNGHYDFFAAKLAASVCGTTVSNKEFNNITVNVYPNPTTDIVNIETAETPFNYTVYDINGREIQNGMFGNNNQINLQNANNGVYFIKVTTVQGSAATVKVVKK